MQTFFADGGGLRKPKTKKYWLVAPFSVQALSFIFKDTAVEKDAISAAKSYIEKTFGLAFYVPPPILANWRDYLLRQLRIAFPEHPLGDLTAARDAFDFAHMGALVTPRQLKLFVNNLVVLYRQKDEDIALATMALYLLHRDSIKGAEIADDLLSPMEQRLAEGPDWKVAFAALHYDVSTADAAQILLKEPLIAALRQGSSSALQGLAKRPGFIDVLVKQVGQELTDVTNMGGILPTKIAAAVGGLPNASSPDFAAIWHMIGDRLKDTENWDGLEDETAEGLKMALTHCPEEQKGGLCQALASSLAKANWGILQEVMTSDSPWQSGGLPPHSPR